MCSFKIIAGCKSGHTHARVCVKQLLQCSLGVLGLWGREPRAKLPSFNSIKCTLWCVIAIILFYGFERSSTFPLVILNINFQLPEVLKMVQVYVFHEQDVGHWKLTTLTRQTFSSITNPNLKISENF